MLSGVLCCAGHAGGGHASLASEQQYLFLSHRAAKPLLVGQYVVVIQADMGQPLVSVEVGVTCGCVGCEGDRSGLGSWEMGGGETTR
jgi:hypothetical protein